MQAEPHVFHRVCAYPVRICWLLGAVCVNAAVLCFLSDEVSIITMISNWDVLWPLVLGAVPASCLGFFFGMWAFGLIVFPVCSKVNGSPYKAGEGVLILGGKARGKVAIIREMTIGQGGNKLARVRFLLNGKPRGGELFDEYTLYRLPVDDPRLVEPVSSETAESSKTNINQTEFW